MGSACVKESKVVNNPPPNYELVPSAAPILTDEESKTTAQVANESVIQQRFPNPTSNNPTPNPDNLDNLDNLDNNNADDSLPPPPPPNCPPWSKLTRQQRYQLTANDPLMAIESLDEYWFKKINKYIVNNKLPALGTSKKGDGLWKNMFNAQQRSQKKRKIIWDSYMVLNFQDLLPAPIAADGSSSTNDQNRDESTTESKENQSVDNPSDAAANNGPKGMLTMQPRKKVDNPSDAAANNGPKGMLAMQPRKKGLAGIESKSSASLKPKTKVSMEKRQVACLKLMDNTIKRIRRIANLLKTSMVDKPEENGRQMVYKRCLDHLLMLENIVDPYRKAKLNLDQTILNLYKMQILGHEQQMKQWLAEEENWGKEEGEEETQGLLSGEGGRSSSDNPMLGT